MQFDFLKDESHIGSAFPFTWVQVKAVVKCMPKKAILIGIKQPQTVFVSLPLLVGLTFKQQKLSFVFRKNTSDTHNHKPVGT